MTTLHMLHVLIVAHNHGTAAHPLFYHWHLAMRYLHRVLPKSTPSVRSQTLHWLVRHNISPKHWLGYL